MRPEAALLLQRRAQCQSFCRSIEPSRKARSPCVLIGAMSLAPASAGPICCVASMPARHSNSTKSRHSKHVDGMAGAAIKRQIGHDFPHYRRKLEPMPAEAGCDGHIGMVGVTIQDEMAIGSQRVDTNL